MWKGITKDTIAKLATVKTDVTSNFSVGKNIDKVGDLITDLTILAIDGSVAAGWALKVIESMASQIQDQ